jgi:LysM repeat protein
MKSNYKPLSVAVFLVLGGLVFRNFSIPGQQAIKTVSLARPQALIGIAEGAEAADFSALVQNVGAAVTDNSPAAGDMLNAGGLIYGAAIQDPGQPIGQALDALQSFQYTVKQGDTLSRIAAKFKVSVASIVNVNPNIRKKLVAGSQLTVLGAVPVPAPPQATSTLMLPNFNSDFILPAQGYNEGVLEADNSVNIENSCGTPVVAAADGIVVPDNNIVNAAGGWNDGYGTFVLIEQPFGNGVYTRYSHLQESLASIGDYVRQGQQIGLMGQSGSASDCELSFQVQGAKNPLAK